MKKNTVLLSSIKRDGFVKSPSAALRFIFRHCGVLLCTPHSSRFARLASGAFFCAVDLDDFFSIASIVLPFSSKNHDKEDPRGSWEGIFSFHEVCQ
jgi:hypothetical protein